MVLISVNKLMAYVILYMEVLWKVSLKQTIMKKYRTRCELNAPNQDDNERLVETTIK